MRPLSPVLTPRCGPCPVGPGQRVLHDALLGALGGVAFVPFFLAQPVAEIDIRDVFSGTGPEMEPAKEFPAGTGLRCPGAEPGELLVESKMERDDLVPEFRAGVGLPPLR